MSFAPDTDSRSDRSRRSQETGTFSAGLEEIKGGLLTGNQLAQATHVALLKVLQRTAWLGWGVAAVLALLLLLRGR